MLFLSSAATIKLPYYLFPRRKLKYSNETNTFLLGIVISIEVSVLNLRLLTSYKFKVDQKRVTPGTASLFLMPLQGIV